jgi:hypothetical protein
MNGGDEPPDPRAEHRTPHDIRGKVLARRYPEDTHPERAGVEQRGVAGTMS